MQTKASRKTDGDFLRTVASFAVVLIHVIGEYVGPMPYAPSLILPATLNAFAHVSIPIFIMLSGRFMLSRPASIKNTLRKTRKTAVQLLCWGLFYCLADIFVFGNPLPSFSDAITAILTKPLHLWYFYAAIALYLMTPPLAVFTQNATKTQYLYVLVFTFFVGSVLHILVSADEGILSVILSKMKLSTSVGFLFCYLFGDYVYRFDISPRARKTLYSIGVILAIFMPSITLYLASVRGGAPSYTLYSFVSPTVLCPAMGVFVWTKHYFERHSIRFETLVRTIAAATPGIYGLHIFILWQMPPTLLGTLPLGLRALLISIFVYIISALIVCITKKVFHRRRIMQDT